MKEAYNKYISKTSTTFFAFNVWGTESAKAIIDAGRQSGHAVILQTSSRVFAELEKAEFASWVRAYADRSGISVYLHLDHCEDISRIEDAVRYGWDSVMLDASKAPLKDNILQTQQVCAYAHAQGTLVEAEVGYIGKTTINKNEDSQEVASIEDIKEFLSHTNIDLFAAAIGTAHGLYHGAPRIRFDLIRQIGELTDIPFVIHGGTGLSDETFVKLLACRNVKKINISTDVKQAYRQAVVDCWNDGRFEANGFEATEIEKQIRDKIRKMALQKFAFL